MIAARRENVLEEAAARIVDQCGGGEVLIKPVDLLDRHSLEVAASHAIETPRFSLSFRSSIRITRALTRHSRSISSQI